ncbi:MAG: hypothetical protein LBU04_05730, partial [Christensenellaceae bacterium]|nr:hypothetical protein [Christensenellaceae bacterium]
MYASKRIAATNALIHEIDKATTAPRPLQTKSVITDSNADNNTAIITAPVTILRAEIGRASCRE